MRYRQFGRTGWEVSEIGYGMWGMGSWTNSDDQESLESLQAAVEMGCNFFDTAFVYGDGHSEHLLGETVRANRDRQLYTATKVPPMNRKWPAPEDSTLQESYPADHVEEYVHRSLRNADVQSFDLVQLHTWNDDWLRDDRWFYKLDDLRSQKLIKAIGISLNRWEPWNGVRAVRTGQIDAVQVIYNIFDQNPEDELFPACAEMKVAVIARVPFDEGTLTGTLTKESTWPEGDWRNIYFVPDNLGPSVDRAEVLKESLHAWNREHGTDMTMPELALRFILSNPTVGTIIPGMRKLSHVQANIAASDAGSLPEGLHEEMKAHRWVRKPTPWSQ
ncbi:MAG TPA: aldo/keto reductase [Candidatus Binatia bacterium]|nr:aldo/keto reductase [Candidatus Binatia bacterium]